MTAISSNRRTTVLIISASTVAAILFMATFAYIWSPLQNADARKYKGITREFYLFNMDDPKIDEDLIGLPADLYTIPEMTVKKGDTVVIHFYNVEPEADDRHSFTMQDKPYITNVALDGGQNQTITFAANETGIFTYFCTFHIPTMKGQLVVTPPTLDEYKAQLLQQGGMSTNPPQGANNYNPTITPSNFVSGVNNPYYTLSPGDTFTYESNTEDGLEKNIVIVTNDTKTILGVTTIVVWDRVWLDEELTEETFDWYAQDKAGNVWYMGEDSTEYEDGKAVNTKGSWEAGVDGAKPGIIMEANPQVGDKYRQEYYAGEAEDMAEVVDVGETVTVPYGTFSDCVKTREWSPIDPELNENKFHCSEVGTVVLEVVIDTGEKTELVDLA